MLLVSIFFALDLSQADPPVYCVNPREGEKCNCNGSGIVYACRTLDEYLSAPEDYFTDIGATFRFMPGTHYTHRTLNASNIRNLRLVKDGEESVTVVIDSGNENVWFAVNNSLNVSVEGIIFVTNISCHYQYAFQFHNVSGLVFSDTSYNSSCGGYISVSHSHNFMLSNTTVISFSVSVLIHNTTGLVAIKHSNFTGGSNSSSVFIYSSDYSYNCSLYNQHVIENSMFRDVYGGVHMQYSGVFSGCLNISVRESFFVGARKYGLELQSVPYPKSHTNDWKMFIELDSVNFEECSTIGLLLSLYSFDHVYISGCTFKNNVNTAFEVFVGKNLNSTVYMENCTFAGNEVPTSIVSVPATALSIQSSESCTTHAINSFIMKQVHFIENSHSKLGIGDLETPLVSLCLQELTIIDCIFSNNSGTSLRAVSSTFTVIGNLTFINNTANEGAALYLYGGSRMIMDPSGAQVSFTGNHALSTGGALQIANNNLYPPFFDPVCFLVAPEESEPLLIFSNNTAQNGGDAIYGGFLDQAIVTNSSMSCIQLTQNVSNFSFPTLDDRRNNLSLISSQPSRVCLCDRAGPKCLNISKMVSAFPGEKIELNAFTVGQHFGTAKGTVHAQFLDTNTSVPLNKAYKLQKVTQYSCELNMLTYMVQSSQTNVNNTLVLTAIDSNVLNYYDITAIDNAIEKYIRSGNTTIPVELLQIPIFVSIFFKKCPPGFKLVNDSCLCNSELEKFASRYDVECIIGSIPKIQRKKNLWIDVTGDCLSYSEECLSMHCTVSKVKVEQGLSYTQCIGNHAGILCSDCQKNYSLAIGSSRCLHHCNDDYLALILLFAVLGVLLVALVKFLNLTVTQGAVNGVIFYANIIQTSNYAFLPVSQHNVNIFAVVIAWINLDFGIETCFARGLNMYTKTWLQFLFPFYIWALVLGIIFMCHFSQRATALIGNNAVQVLSTLFLLSYNKLLHTITVAYTLANVVHVNASTDHPVIETEKSVGIRWRIFYQTHCVACI